MYYERLITGVAAALAGSAAIVTVVALYYGVYAILLLSLALGVAAFFMWYQASGRLATYLYRSVEEQGRRNSGREQSRTGSRGGFGAGPRDDWSRSDDRDRKHANGGRQSSRQQTTAPGSDPDLSRTEAYRTLGLEPGADDKQIKQAYRERVKDVHPDTDGGDEEEFKKVNRAYERLS